MENFECVYLKTEEYTKISRESDIENATNRLIFDANFK